MSLQEVKYIQVSPYIRFSKTVFSQETKQMLALCHSPQFNHQTICLFVFPQKKGKLDRVAILVPRRFFNLCTVFVKYRKITRFGPM